MVTSASPLQTAARESLDALDELMPPRPVVGRVVATPAARQGPRSSRSRVHWTIPGRCARAAPRATPDAPVDPRARFHGSERVGARGAVQARPQFEARLLNLSGEQLQAARAELEVSFVSLRDRRIEAAGQLERATEELLAELRTDPAPAAQPSRAGRSATRSDLSTTSQRRCAPTRTASGGCCSISPRLRTPRSAHRPVDCCVRESRASLLALRPTTARWALPDGSPTL